MTLKLYLFFALLVFTTIEAKLFKDFFQKDHLRFATGKNLPQKATDHLVRKRRDTEDITVTTSDEFTSDDGADFMKFFLAAAWEGDKFDVLGGFIEEMTDTDTNITIIGWQRVLDAEGKIQEIHTLQLVIPPKPEDADAPNNIVEDDDNDDDDTTMPHEDIKEMREIFEPMSKVGMPACVTMEKFDNDGENEELIYMDKDELYVHAEGFSVYNKTTTTDAKEVSDFITSLKAGALGKPVVLKYDVDGHLLVNQSYIRPQILGTVMDYSSDLPDKMFNEAPQIIAEVAYQYPREEVPKQLALRYNEVYPKYKWRVLFDAEHFSVHRAVLVEVTYDNFDFDETSDVSFVVIGVTKR